MSDLLRDTSAVLARMLGARSTFVVARPARETGDALAALAQVEFVTPLGGHPVACVDLRALGVEAREKGKPLLVDATACGPDGCAAVRLGAHAAMVGVSDSWCVVALSRDCAHVMPGVMGLVRDLPLMEEADCGRVGELVQARAAWWRASSDAAQVVANYLRCHPRVRAVRYPGLKADPSFAVAARTLEHGFGPYVDVLLDGGEGWLRVTCTTGDPRVQVIGLERRLAGGDIGT